MGEHIAKIGSPQPLDQFVLGIAPHGLDRAVLIEGAGALTAYAFIQLDGTIDRLDDFPQQLQDEISHFFSIYKTLEEKEVVVEGWFPLEDALQVIAEARARYSEQRAG